jgi:hypothetical protein
LKPGTEGVYNLNVPLLAERRPEDAIFGAVQVITNIQHFMIFYYFLMFFTTSSWIEQKNAY